MTPEWEIPALSARQRGDRITVYFVQRILSPLAVLVSAAKSGLGSQSAA
jgi:hypothetical protein